MLLTVADINEGHYPTIREIYLQGIATGHATFQTEAPTWHDWDLSHLQHSRFVALHNNTITGWAALSAVSSRCVYTGVAEVSIYIDEQYRGKGVGKQLMQALITSSEKNMIWTLQAGIFPENKASIALHHNNGFRTVGIREKIGKMNGTWRDTVLLERRSKTTGL